MREVGKHRAVPMSDMTALSSSRQMAGQSTHLGLRGPGGAAVVAPEQGVGPQTGAVHPPCGLVEAHQPLHDVRQPAPAAGVRRGETHPTAPGERHGQHVACSGASDAAECSRFVTGDTESAQILEHSTGTERLNMFTLCSV